MDVIGLRMKAFQDMYEVTDNLGETPPPSAVWRRGGGAGLDPMEKQRRNVLRLCCLLINEGSVEDLGSSFLRNHLLTSQLLLPNLSKLSRLFAACCIITSFLSSR